MYLSTSLKIEIYIQRVQNFSLNYYSTITFSWPKMIAKFLPFIKSIMAGIDPIPTIMRACYLNSELKLSKLFSLSF